MRPDGVGVDGGGIARDEAVLAGVGEQVAGVMLEAGDVRGRADGGDVALGVGGVDHHERVLERRLPVP